MVLKRRSGSKRLYSPGHLSATNATEMEERKFALIDDESQLTNRTPSPLSMEKPPSPGEWTSYFTPLSVCGPAISFYLHVHVCWLSLLYPATLQAAKPASTLIALTCYMYTCACYMLVEFSCTVCHNIIYCIT